MWMETERELFTEYLFQIIILCRNVGKINGSGLLVAWPKVPSVGDSRADWRQMAMAEITQTQNFINRPVNVGVVDLEPGVT